MLKQNLDVFDCGTKLVMWPYVKGGCQGDKGFQFDDSRGTLIAATDGATTCATDNGATKQITLSQCTGAANQKFTLSPTSGLIKSGTGNCLALSDEHLDSTNVWARKLSGTPVRYAVVFLNTGSASASVTCDKACVAQMPELVGKKVKVRDLWSHTEMGTTPPLDHLDADNLAAAGGHAMLLLTPTSATSPSLPEVITLKTDDVAASCSPVRLCKAPE